MTAFVAMWNRLFAAVLDSALLPLDRVAPIAGLAAVSVGLALALFVTFKVTSDQPRIAEVKRAMQAGLFEMRLFNHDPRAILQAQSDVLRALWRYLRLSAMSLLSTSLPLVLVAAHLHSHYGYQGLDAGASALVKVQMRSGAETLARSLVLDLPSGLRADTPMVWSPTSREAAWRITAERDGDYVLSVALGRARFTKTIVVSNAVRRRSPIRLDAGIFNQLSYPAEPPLPGDAPISSIAVTYREGYVPVAGWEVRWLTAFFIVSLVVVALLRRRFKVTL